MDNANLFAGIDLIELIPLVVIGAVESAPKQSNVPVASALGALSGSDFLRELLNCGNDKRIYRVLRMKKETFRKLCIWFRQKGHLQDSRFIRVEQQVAQFLWIINFNMSIEATAERFRLTNEPVSRYVFILLINQLLIIY